MKTRNKRASIAENPQPLGIGTVYSMRTNRGKIEELNTMQSIASFLSKKARRIQRHLK